MWIWMVLIASIGTDIILSCPQNCAECLAQNGYTICSNGYYHDGNRWILCPGHECETCRGSNQCTRCSEGYYLDGHHCIHCQPECATCQGPDGCTNCTEGYYLDGQQCTQCPPGCATCPGSDRCTNCTDGYYQKGYWCKQCIYGCKTCTEPSICINCHEGFFYDRSRCIECPRKCETCSNYTTCTSCKAGFYGSECNDVCSMDCKNETCDQMDGSCQYRCLDGYKGKACLRCPEHCISCTPSTSCASCEAGYFGDHCQPCRNCKNDMCSHDGHCIDGCKNGSYVSTFGCRKCPYGCLNCTSPTTCESCINGYFGRTCEQPCRNCKDDVCSHDGRCIHGCKDGFYNITTGCMACPYCLTCTSPTTCTSCPSGYYGNRCQQLCRNCKDNRCSIDGQCTDGCMYRHYRGTTGCDPCPDNCSSCISGSLCDQCNAGSHGTTCQQRCPHNCTTCTSERNCSECKVGYFGQSCGKACPSICKDRCNKVNGECAGCIDGYYKEGKRCKICSKGCARCRNVNICNNCQSGYFREQVLYGVNCIACGQNCSVCTIKDACTTCNQGHLNVKGRCLSCHNCGDVKACSSQSACPQCLDGFWGRYCGDTCNDTCKSCNKTTGECTGCKGNTFGQYCELKCSRNCLQLSDTNSTCRQHNGVCTDGCIQGFTGPDCIEEIPQQTSANFALILGSILGGIVVVIAVVIVGIMILRRRVKRTDLKAEGGQPSGARVPRTVNENLNPAYNYIDIDPAAESGHQTTPVYAVVQKKTTRISGQANKSRGQDDGADNVYDVASAGRSQGGATSSHKSRSDAQGDIYSHINHTAGLRKYRHDNEGTYDHVTHQHLQKAGVDDTYDVTSDQTTSRVCDQAVKKTANTSKDEYSTIGNVQ